MKYKTGELVRIGDAVLIEKGRTQGIIHTVIETPLQMKEWGLSEAGVSITSEPFGRVFWPEAEIEDPVIFVERK